MSAGCGIVFALTAVLVMLLMLPSLREKLKETLAAVKEVHPYEEPVINVIPLYQVGI